MFNLSETLNSLSKRYPEGDNRPVIGVTSNCSGEDLILRQRYCNQIVAAGGVPVVIPPVADTDVILSTLSTLDGIIFSGGGDFNPLWVGEEPSPRLHNINAARDEAELLTATLAFRMQMPMLGTCRGVQTMAMALGGHVMQDISDTQKVKHSQDAANTEATHSVNLEEGSILHAIYGADSIMVNSFHHQVVDNPGPHFHTTAISPDGFIEAIESSEHKPMIGVQWHPEWLGENGLPIFQWLVDEATLYMKAKRIHSQVITLDSHCDTPMFFPQGADFSHRDNRILVDLHKMADGHQDAVTMVAYIPQPKEGETFASISPLPAESPKHYADLIFDKIEDIIGRCDGHISLARTSHDLIRNKKEGRRSIMIGIENGLALDHDISNVEYFAKRGVKYITLCHNGDNDICDSARGNATWGGLSPFGRKVVSEMNRCGLMVDLSHAAESTFYDAIECSSTPIVCSHSNCKALCDVPRNLTDDQLRALAANGGVAQITLYHGFLLKDGEASIIDAMNHLRHAIDIMGIDHVGLGTDFDGDGGVCGIANSSELINFTTQLLRRHYPLSDIEKIWGGNWLRVMRLAEGLCDK